jgi:hypothetical protein
MSKLTPDQDEFYGKLLTYLTTLTRPKFEAGAAEHKGNIWDLTEEQLEQAELEEIIDLMHYRLTKMMKHRLKEYSGQKLDKK